MKTNLFPALKLTLLCILFFVVVYGVVVLGAAYLVAPNHGRGEVAVKDGQIVGFANIGQSFTKDKYFWSRPSAVNYNPAGSGGSNKGPSNPEYLQNVRARIDTFLVHNPGIKKSQIPVELVTASGSGLDPDISPDGARVQLLRVASVRNTSKEKLDQLVNEHIERPLLGLFGPSRVNVLQLNLDLEKLDSAKH
jgi:potassium-transporting ATPase KdpC subunit